VNLLLPAQVRHSSLSFLLHFGLEEALIGKVDQVRVRFTRLTRETIVTYLRLEVRGQQEKCIVQHAADTSIVVPVFILQTTCFMHMRTAMLP
jgi:hypothetical protein